MVVITGLCVVGWLQSNNPTNPEIVIEIQSPKPDTRALTHPVSTSHLPRFRRR